MGTKPVFALAGLVVASSMLSGCRSGPSAGYDRGSSMVSQAPTTYNAPGMLGGRNTSGMSVASQRPMPQTESTTMTTQPMPSATTFPSATTSSITAATPSNQYMGGNAFSPAPATTMPASANYQMQPQNTQMQAPTMQSQDDSMPRMQQPFGASPTPRSFGSMPQQQPQQGYRTDRFQSLTPGAEQQQP